MRYATLGNTGLEVSILGFGCMRFPVKDGRVVRELSTPLLRRAVELGINYFDTAIEYCGGDSQAAVGEALEGIRDQVILSTKNHFHRSGRSEWRRHLEESLKLLRTDYIDIYSHHGISWSTYENYLNPEKGGHTAEMFRAKEEGLIRHIAFSYHDTPENLIKVIDTGYYESVTLQFNLLDQQNKEAIRYAREKGMGVVVMGPVGGGRLGLPSEAIAEMTGGNVRTTPEAALRFVWGTQGVTTALSGMEDLGMLEENVSFAVSGEPFSDEDIAGLNAMIAERKKKSGLYCTACGYCVPVCPRGVAIPENLDLLNLSAIYDLPEGARERYQRLEGKASNCIDCGKCLVKCPQRIDIPKRLRETAILFDENAGTVQYKAVIEDLNPNGSFAIVLEVFNLSEVTKTIAARFTVAEGVELNPASLSIESVKPFARVSRRVEGSFSPNSDAIKFTVACRSNGEKKTVTENHRIAFLRKDGSTGWDSGPWIRFKPTPENFTKAGDTIDRHGVSFRLSYSKTSLLLIADVQDDFLFPTVRKRHEDGQGDCIELLLEGRPAGKSGVTRVALYPGTPGKAPPFYKAPRTDMGIKLKAEAAEKGYRLEADIPFKSFCTGVIPPKRIGFDIGCITADSAGVRIGNYRWSGGGHGEWDASMLREMWLA